jgi:hypothetical protein
LLLVSSFYRGSFRGTNTIFIGVVAFLHVSSLSIYFFCVIFVLWIVIELQKP